MIRPVPAVRARRRFTLLAVLAVGLVAAGCSSSGAASAPTTTAASDAAAPLLFTAADYTITPPATVTGGEVAIALHNRGTEEHQLSLFRLGDGQDPKAVLGLLDNGDLSFVAHGALVGGPNAVEPGQTASVTSNLEPGTYVAFCAVPSPSDQRPHFMKGMRTSFTVLPAAAQVTVAATAGTIAITATGFQPPAGFTGRGTYAVTNNAPFPAELSILRIATGKTTDDAVAFLAGHAPPGPPPFSAAGGVTAMSPSSTSYVDLALDPGHLHLLVLRPRPASRVRASVHQRSALDRPDPMTVSAAPRRRSPRAGTHRGVADPRNGRFGGAPAYGPLKEEVSDGACASVVRTGRTHLLPGDRQAER